MNVSSSKSNIFVEYYGKLKLFMDTGLPHKGQFNRKKKVFGKTVEAQSTASVSDRAGLAGQDDAKV